MTVAKKVRFIGICLRQVDDGVSVDIGDDSFVIKKPTEEEWKKQMFAEAGAHQEHMENDNKKHAGKLMWVWQIVIPEPDTRLYIKPRNVPYHWDLPETLLDELGLVELADIARVKGVEGKNALIKEFPVVELDIIKEDKDGTTELQQDVCGEGKNGGEAGDDPSAPQEPDQAG